MKSTVKLIVAAVAVALISDAVYIAWPDAPPPALGIVTVTGPAGWLAAVGLGLWSAWRFVRDNLNGMLNEKPASRGDAGVAGAVSPLPATKVDVANIEAHIKAAGNERRDVAAQIQELAKLVDAFFVEADALAGGVAALRQMRTNVSQNRLSDEIIGVVAAQDPSLAAVLNHPAAWTDDIRAAITGALDREIGFIGETAAQYRRRGLKLLERWQSLRATLAGIDYHLKDSEAVVISQRIGEHLTACFTRLDDVDAARAAYETAEGQKLAGGLFRWRLPARLTADKSGGQKLLGQFQPGQLLSAAIGGAGFSRPAGETMVTVPGHDGRQWTMPRQD